MCFLLTAGVLSAQAVKDGKEKVATALGRKVTVAGPQSLTGTWWRERSMIALLNLTPDQQKKMDEIFQQSRLKLIDLNANLQKDEATLEVLMESERPDEARVLTQIDRVADSRAALEKANAKMLFGIRQSMNPDQWTKLQQSTTKRKFTTWPAQGPTWNPLK
jgi:Spy/CpxP family protein refolding chaperone